MRVRSGSAMKRLPLGCCCAVVFAQHRMGRRGSKSPWDGQQLIATSATTTARVRSTLRLTK